MKELSRSAPERGSHRVYLVGGSTALLAGFRASTVDVDLYAPDDRVFRDIQTIKERLDMNVEFARPEDFVPALPGTADRHVFIERLGRVDFYHYDPYAQTFAKVVRGFARDREDAESFVRSGMVDPERLRTLVRGVPDRAFAKYPALTKRAVIEAVDGFVASPGGSAR
jgi:uncharacterized nucleotidyltransferase DUF6036